MKVLVIGGTGYIGSAVVRRLRAGGHVPVVSTRTRPEGDAAAADRRLVDLDAPDTLRAAVTDDIDAVVHAATPTGDWDADLAALDALGDVLHGGDRALLYVSGVWVLGESQGGVDETAAPRPIRIVSRRDEAEAAVLGLDGVRGIVVRPGIVHGAGGGIPRMMVDWVREAGIGRYVGAEGVRWPMVHVDDLADLVVLALEKAEAGAVLHGVAEPAVRTAGLAMAADLAAGGSGRAAAWSRTDAADTLGSALVEALALHQVVTAPAARALGWTPRGPDAVADVRDGSYSALGSSVLVRPQEAASRHEDVREIVALVRAVQDAQQREHAAAFVALFQRDAVWTTAHGHRMIGRDEIGRFTHRVLPGAMQESTATYEVEHVLFLGDEVAVVNIRQRPVTWDGAPLEDAPEGRPVYVLARNGDRWRIAAGQNTQVR